MERNRSKTRVERFDIGIEKDSSLSAWLSEMFTASAEAANSESN